MSHLQVFQRILLQKLISNVQQHFETDTGITVTLHVRKWNRAVMAHSQTATQPTFHVHPPHFTSKRECYYCSRVRGGGSALSSFISCSNNSWKYIYQPHTVFFWKGFLSNIVFFVLFLVMLYQPSHFFFKSEKCYNSFQKELSKRNCEVSYLAI